MYFYQNAVESEMHVLMSCDNYIDMNARINLFACANAVIDHFNSLNKENQFKVMLQSENPSLMQKRDKYIFHILRAGHDTLNIVTPSSSISLMQKLAKYFFHILRAGHATLNIVTPSPSISI